MTPEEQDFMKSIGVFSGAIGAIAGAGVTSLIVLINGWRQRIADATRNKNEIRAANERHLRGLALEAAIADWKKSIADAERWKPKGIHETEAHRPAVDPLDFFLIKKLKMVQTFGDAPIDVSDFPAQWAHMAEFQKWFTDRAERRRRTTKQDDSEQDGGLKDVPS